MRASRPATSVALLAVSLIAVLASVSTGVALPRSASPETDPGFAAPTDGRSVADLAEALDYDVGRIFRFVSDEIRYEPYPGILRGAQGTLDARAGNSADQALLLAALLDVSLVPHRFASGPLASGSVDALMSGALMDAASAREHALAVLTGGPAEATTAAPAASADVETFAAGLEEDAARIPEVASRQLDSSVKAIGSALDGAGVILEPGFSGLPELEREGHVWVQAALGAEWLDLDPGLPDAQPGSPLEEAHDTAETLPDEMRHRVDFVVLLETVSGGRIVTQEILSQGAFADQLTRLPIAFSHVEPEGLEALGIAIGRLAGEAGVRYEAVLAMGGRTVVGSRSISFGVRSTDLFGEPAETSDVPQEGEATAEWLEVRVSRPDGSTAIARRTVFDRIGPEARAALVIDAAGATADLPALEPVELVDLDGDEHMVYPPMRAVHAFAVATHTTPGTYLAEPPVGIDNVGVMSSVGWAYHWLRDALEAELATERGVRTFLSGPNVVSWHLGVSARADAEPTTSLALDIWHRDTGSLAAGPGGPAAHPAVLAGVLAHVAERIAMRDGFESLPGQTGEAFGVGALFEAAEAAGVRTRVFQGSLPAGVSYGVAADMRLAEALASGDVVVIPERPLQLAGEERIGWWRVDPVSGRTVDEMADGSGSEGTEYNIPLSTSFRVAMCFVALSEKIVGAIALAAKALGYDTASLVLGGVALGLWTANFFNPGWGKVCRGG